MRGYRLSPQAEQTLTEIIGWTVGQFGIDQAIKYKAQLTARLSALASGQMPHGRPCNILLAGKRTVNDLEFYREGRHYIIYRNSTEGFYVLDFVHGSRNLEAVIEELSKLS